MERGEKKRKFEDGRMISNYQKRRLGEQTLGIGTSGEHSRRLVLKNKITERKLKCVRKKLNFFKLFGIYFE